MEHAQDDEMVMVCNDDAPKAGKFVGQEPGSFVGKLVRIAFKATMPDGRATQEHMWVEVVEAPALDWLKGTLRNTPFFDSSFDRGDSVGFRVSEIEEMKDLPAALKVD